MNIKFTGKYKSLKDFEWGNIPKFVTITGLNGAGKSQLLELIFEFLKTSFIDNNGFSAHNSIKLEIRDAQFAASDVIYLKGEWQLNEPKDVNLAEIQSNNSILLRRLKDGGGDLQQLMNSDFKLYKKLIDIRSYFGSIGVAIKDITPDAFREQLAKSTIADDVGIVQKVSEYFYNYRLRYLDLKIQDKSDKEITNEIGAKPWDVLRDIIKEANLPFEITDPGSMGIVGSYKFSITKNTTHEAVKFDDLSSGERVLFSLAFLMFNSQEAKKLPKLLLLDEPDAHLHPSMIAQLLKVLKNVLVEKYGVQIIMTTHSPSTVAISNEKSIFLMEASIGYPQPTEKDIAIKSLLSGIPNLYVSYKDRRQVFVESGYDVEYYDKIYKRVFQYLNQEVNLNFISSGDAATDKNGQPVANCDQVIKITKILTDAGNPHIYGIIDFDEGKNKSTENLIVLGEGNRYSIENYIFDPVLVGMLLLREKFITADELGISEIIYNDISTHTQDNLQDLSNYVVEKVLTETKGTNFETKDCVLLNGITIAVPNWYLMNQGHNLEHLLIKVFPKLNELKKNKEEKLKLAIIEKVIDDFPKLISQDVIITLKQIQE
jgi:ABC-type cobalamin/Fe3+-siderophores transport system ATPase subunit